MFEILRNKIILVFFIACSSVLQAAIPNFDNPTSYVGTTGKAKYSRPFTQNSAFSVLGEAGPRNYRVGATLGWLFQDNQRFKISGEYLWQDIIYSFYTGNSREWVQQGAVGAQYQYDLYSNRFLPQFNLKGGYSHAPNKLLTPVSASFINPLGLVTNVVDDRRIAGSDAGYISPGLSIQPWPAGRLGVDLNYDDVRYNRIYTFNEHAEGFGGTANLTQQLGPNTELGISVGIREPFNAYQANIAYTLPNHPNWALGLDGNYVEGKHLLPNTYNVGISVNYILDGQPCPTTLEKDPPLHPVNSDLSSWTADPAIYLPQVLAITDERVAVPLVSLPQCNAVGVVNTIPTQNVFGDFTVDTVLLGIFSGTTPFTYSASLTGAPAGTTVSINSAGLLSVHPNPSGNYSFNVTVTATNTCGTASTTFLVNANFNSMQVK